MMVRMDVMILPSLSLTNCLSTLGEHNFCIKYGSAHAKIGVFFSVSDVIISAFLTASHLDL